MTDQYGFVNQVPGRHNNEMKLANQTRRVLDHCGSMDAESMAEYLECARYLRNFTQNEGCGKCVPCREGTKRMLQILERIIAGKGVPEDLDLLEELADTVSSSSLCGLGTSAADYVVSTLSYFREEYLERIVHKRCPTHTCKGLTSFAIDPEKCKGCSKCARVCPAGAISGEIKKTYRIDSLKCVKCGACVGACPFHAVAEV